MRIKDYTDFFFFPISWLLLAVIFFLFNLPNFSKRWSELFTSVFLFLGFGPLLGFFTLIAIAPRGHWSGPASPNSIFLSVYQGFFQILISLLGSYAYGLPSALLAGVLYGFVVSKIFQWGFTEFVRRPVVSVLLGVILGGVVGLIVGFTQSVAQYAKWAQRLPISGVAGALCGLITLQYLLFIKRKNDPRNQSLQPTSPSGRRG